MMIVIEFPKPVPIDWFAGCRKYFGLWDELKKKDETRRRHDAQYYSESGEPRWELVLSCPSGGCYAGDRVKLVDEEGNVICYVCKYDAFALAQAFAHLFHPEVRDTAVLSLKHEDGSAVANSEVVLLLFYMLRAHWLDWKRVKLPKIPEPETLIKILELSKAFGVFNKRMTPVTSYFADPEVDLNAFTDDQKLDFISLAKTGGYDQLLNTEIETFALSLGPSHLRMLTEKFGFSFAAHIYDRKLSIGVKLEQKIRNKRKRRSANVRLCPNDDEHPCCHKCAQGAVDSEEMSVINLDANRIKRMKLDLSE